MDLSDVNANANYTENQQPAYESSASSDSDHISKVYEECNEHDLNKTRQETPLSNSNIFMGDATNDHQSERHFQEYFRFTSTEKRIKIETLKEERQVVRVMRETAALHKIIAEEKLKHVLWAKKQDMEMMSGNLPGDQGSSGAIREAGGAFGKREAAQEEEYFYRKQREQLQDIKSHLDKEISFHQEQIKRHEDAIRRHREQISSIPEKK